MTFRPSAVQAEPQIHVSSSMTTKSDTNIDTSERGDVLCRGLWTNGQDAILDIRVTDTDQASYIAKDPARVL